MQILYIRSGSCRTLGINRRHDSKNNKYDFLDRNNTPTQRLCLVFWFVHGVFLHLLYNWSLNWRWFLLRHSVEKTAKEHVKQLVFVLVDDDVAGLSNFVDTSYIPLLLKYVWLVCNVKETLFKSQLKLSPKHQRTAQQGPLWKPLSPPVQYLLDFFLLSWSSVG